MSRFFAFGCSFTQYQWPTWADILSKSYDHYENWGQTGAGNHYIYNALVECHLKKQFSKDDVVAIMWSSTGREDRYVDCKWITPGNIWISNLYGKSFLDKFVDERGFILRDLALMYGAKSLLDQIGCRYIFLLMVPIVQPDDYLPEITKHNMSDVLPYYKNLTDIVRPSIFEAVFDNNWDSREFIVPSKRNFWQRWYDTIKDSTWPSVEKKTDFASLPDYIKKECKEVFGFFIPNLETDHGRDDYHPTPLEHLEYIEKVLGDHEISLPTRNWVEDCDRKVRNGTWAPESKQTIKRW